MGVFGGEAPHVEGGDLGVSHCRIGDGGTVEAVCLEPRQGGLVAPRRVADDCVVHLGPPADHLPMDRNRGTPPGAL